MSYRVSIETGKIVYPLPGKEGEPKTVWETTHTVIIPNTKTLKAVLIALAESAETGF